MQELPLGNLLTISPLELTFLVAFGRRSFVVGEVFRAQKDVEFLAKLARNLRLHLGVGSPSLALWHRGVIGFGPIPHPDDVNHRVALRDAGLQHLADGAVIGLKIGLLDREATHGQQPLLDRLAHSAQIARRRRNKDFRSPAFRASSALICLCRPFAHLVSGVDA